MKCATEFTMCRLCWRTAARLHLAPSPGSGTAFGIRVQIGVCFGILFCFCAFRLVPSASTAENAPQTITYKLLNCIIAPVESVFFFWALLGVIVAIICSKSDTHTQADACRRTHSRQGSCSCSPHRDKIS